MSATDPMPPASPRPAADLNPRHEPALDFDDKPLSEMTADDYDAIGFMCGLEVHQQIETRTKLFCRCPAGRYVEHHDAEVLRHMRPTLSELGEYDGTALMEFKTRKEIIYLLERSTVCTYEMDDTPPFRIDEEAVRVAIEISRLLNLNLVSELHVMRKQYLDGSIPTGFQRTTMVGLSGEIPFRCPDLGVDKTPRIRQLSLEEDSCREIEDIGHRIVFRTDRLGMPLTETVTEPDLLTPWEVREGGKLLARVARVTDKVRRGPGAARQDVNVSVAGGRRVEIKGVPHHRGLPQLTHNEAFRQLNLLRVRHELQERGLTPDLYELPDKGLAWEVSPLVRDVGRLLRRTHARPVAEALERGDTVIAVLLRGWSGLIAHRTQPGLTFAHELAGRLRVIACLTARPFMVHSDDPASAVSPREWKILRKAFRARSSDALVLAWGPREDASTAAREILARAAEGLVGVPSETRQAFPDGRTDFERILPGPDRMYPDTDTPPVPLPEAWLTEPLDLGETPWQTEERYVEAGLTWAEARTLASSEWSELFDELAPSTPEAARRLAGTMVRRIPYLRRKRRIEGLPDAAAIAPLVRALERGAVAAHLVEPLFDRLARGEGGDDPSEFVEAQLAATVDQATVDAAVRGVADRLDELATRDLDAMVRWAMGQLREELGDALDFASCSRTLRDVLAPHAEGVAEQDAPQS